MICKLCGKDKKLIKAHIIPKSFYKQMQFDKRPTEIHSSLPYHYTQTSHIGIYDKEIICEDCERKFSPWEDYAKKNLFDGLPKNSEIYYNKRIIGYKIVFFEYAKLKLFFLSLLWKSSVTKKELFYQVNAGPFEKKLADMINNNDPGNPKTFTVFAKKFDEQVISQAILNPCPVKVESINFYRFFVSGYKFYIKVDHRNIPKKYEELILSPDNPFYIFIEKFYNSKEFSEILECVKKCKS